MNNNRLQQIRKILNKHSLDALLISNFFNILYFTDFKTLSPEEREAYILVTNNDLYLFTDARYQVNDSKIILKLITYEKSLYSHLQDITKQKKITRLGLEKEDLKYQEYEQLQRNIDTVELLPLEQLVSQLREIKSLEEIVAIKKACEYTDNCLTDMKMIIKPGMSEKEIAWKIEVWIREQRLELAFDSIVAVDKNASIPHYDTKSGNGIIKKNSLVLIDFGINVNGYSSDITRMFSIGKPSAEIVSIYEKLLMVQIKTIHKIPSYKQLISVDRYCRQLINEAGLPNYNHGTGHGIGLEVHEEPKITPRSHSILNQKQVFTIEPGVYIPGKYGMRIEDTVYINERLTPEILTKFPKALQII